MKTCKGGLKEGWGKRKRQVHVERRMERTNRIRKDGEQERDKERRMGRRKKEGWTQENEEQNETYNFLASANSHL
jgi:hypothetical protein